MANINNDIPPISIIIPLYNKEQFIKRAIDSVLAQTVQTFEIIVIGGNSTDGSEETVRRYSDTRIKLINETGSGVANARNQGIAIARSDLIAFLDADDKWPPNYVESILNLKNMFPEVGIYATGGEVSTESTTKPIHHISLPSDYCGLIESYFHMFILEKQAPFPTSSVAIPKSILCEMNMFNPAHSYNEDNELFGKIALKYPVAIDTRVRVSYHIDDPHSLSKNPPNNYSHPLIDILTKFLNEVENSDNEYNDIKLFLDNINLSSAMINVWCGDDDLYKYHVSNIVRKDLLKKEIMYLCLFSMIPVRIRLCTQFRHVIYRLKKIFWTFRV